MLFRNKLFENQLEIIDSLKQDKGIVNIGNAVEIKYMDGSEDVEEYQIVGDRHIPYSDYAVVKEILNLK